MTKKSKIFICLTIAFIIVIYQFTTDRLEYLRLEKKGKIVNATSNYFELPFPGYVNFSFCSDKGQVIKKSKKCPSKTGYEREYQNMKVIYNPENPTEFQNLYDFNNYSLTYRIIFFFGLYLTVMTLVFFQFQRILSGLYRLFRT